MPIQSSLRSVSGQRRMRKNCSVLQVFAPSRALEQRVGGRRLRLQQEADDSDGDATDLHSYWSSRPHMVSEELTNRQVDYKKKSVMAFGIK
jgi:hypothetical protein